jgi:hypothetical protein
MSREVGLKRLEVHDEVHRSEAARRAWNSRWKFGSFECKAGVTRFILCSPWNADEFPATIKHPSADSIG